MNKININDVYEYVEGGIGAFHEKRIGSINNLQLKKILKRKNPYLFKAKHVCTNEEIIRGIVDAHISSNEETVFGDWLEGLAIFINQKVYDGWKSGIPAIDLEFENENTRYIVAIKSGPNWGNSSQIKKMKADFSSAKKTLRTSGSQLNIVAVNGCCYGTDKHPDRGEYFKYCGQQFWSFISGNSQLYLEIIEPLGYKAKSMNESYLLAYSNAINKLSHEFYEQFCKDSGEIDWEELVRFNSAKDS